MCVAPVRRGMTVTALARAFGCSRNNIYKIFNKTSIDTHTLYRLSVILEYNLFDYYSSKLKFKHHIGNQEFTLCGVTIVKAIWHWNTLKGYTL